MASSELMEKLEMFFDDEINSYLGDHGGGAQPVELTGECRSCMSQSGTVNDLILKKVSAVFPFIKKISVTDDVSDEVYEQALNLFTAYKDRK